MPPQLATILAVHLLAVSTPGPDFAVVTHRSLSHGRRAGLLTAAGITTGLVAHLTLVMCGLGAVLAASPMLAKCLSVAGALYLLWIAWGCLRSTGVAPKTDADTPRRGD